MAEVGSIKNQIDLLEKEDKALAGQLENDLSVLPNVPADDVPVGPDETANKEIRRHGAPRDFAFKTKEHWELGEVLGLMDFESAAKLSGARFVVLKGALARLERALTQFMLDLHTGEHGYTEVAPPLLVRDDTMFGTAQLPKFQDDQFSVHAGPAGRELFANLRRGQPLGEAEAIDNPFWLIPTAEVPLTNLVREDIVDEAKLPMRVTAGTPCFRAEAGAAGKDTRGMIRQHQFDKVELVSITTPEQSAEE